MVHCFFDNKKDEIGLLLRDELGGTRLAGSMAMRDICDPKIIEPLAILRGLQLVSGLGIKKLILESDCLLMIQVCISSDTAHVCLEIGVMVNEMHRVLLRFDDCMLQHVYRKYKTCSLVGPLCLAS